MYLGLTIDSSGKVNPRFADASPLLNLLPIVYCGGGCTTLLHAAAADDDDDDEVSIRLSRA